MPNNLTTREKQMLQALKIAQSEMRAYGGSIGAVDSIIDVVEPKPHAYSHFPACCPLAPEDHMHTKPEPHVCDSEGTLIRCRKCYRPYSDQVHKTRRWIVTSPDHPKVGLGRATDIREVKAITKEQSEKAWNQAFTIEKGGQYSNYGQHADGRLRYLELLGIQIED